MVCFDIIHLLSYNNISAHVKGHVKYKVPLTNKVHVFFFPPDCCV